MRQRPRTFLLLGLVAAALSAVGVKVYWTVQDARAETQLHRALQANFRQGRRGIARTMLATPRGWIISQALVNYESPAKWQIEYLHPKLAKARIYHEGDTLRRAVDTTALPDRRVRAPQLISTAGRPQSVISKHSLANYQAKHLGSGTIAHRAVRIIGLAHRETGQLLRVFWIDKQSGLILRQDQLSAKGKLLSSTEFQQITLLPRQPVAQRRVVVKATPVMIKSKPERLLLVERRMGLVELSKRVGFKVLLPQSLPKNFLLLESYALPCPCGCGSISAHLRFGDGVRGFSVFEISQHNKKCAFAKDITKLANRQAEPSRTLRAAFAHKQDLNIVAVGDLEPESLKEIVASF